METTLVKGILIEDRPKALLIEQGRGRNTHRHWIPRSIIPHFLKEPMGMVTQISMHVQGWWLEKPENKGIETI